MRFHRAGVKRLRHPVVGDFTLTYESLELLASWAATLEQDHDQAQPARAADEA